MAKCPPVGKRVCYRANPAAAMLYKGDGLRNGDCGTVTTVPVPGGRRTCMPGPRGGLIYVNWDGGGTFGVFRADLDFSRKSLSGSRRRRRRS